jgi:probable D,D-heptose 1,7-bisphosphate phosphatase
MIKIDNISYLKRGYDKNKLRKIVFMDRDGTIHIDKVETHLIDDLEFSPDTVSFMQRVTSLGYDIIVVTNQSGIGKGHYSSLVLSSYQRG